MPDLSSPNPAEFCGARERIGDVRCRPCGSADLVKLVSRFATVKSEDARLDALTDLNRLGDVDEHDPKSMGRLVKRLGSELGDELGGDALDEMVDRVEGGDDD